MAFGGVQGGVPDDCGCPAETGTGGCRGLGSLAMCDVWRSWTTDLGADAVGGFKEWLELMASREFLEGNCVSLTGLGSRGRSLSNPGGASVMYRGRLGWGIRSTSNRLSRFKIASHPASLTRCAR